MRIYYSRHVPNPDHLSNAQTAALRKLRELGLYDGTIPGDWIPSSEGATKRGVPADYTGDEPELCNARTKSGRPCRALKLVHGRCKWHGGLSTGPTSAEGKARALANLQRYRDRLHAERLAREAVKRGGSADQG